MDKGLLKELLQAVEENRLFSIKTEIKGKAGKTEEGLVTSLVPLEPVMDHQGRKYASVRYQEDDQGNGVLLEPVLPRERLIICGGGHVALQVAEFAAKCDFHVIVCDERPEFANEQRFPWAKQVLCAPFGECIRELKLTPFDFVVIVTRGHACDRECLRHVLAGSEPAYTGMIGSRSRVAKVLEQLREEGYDKDRIQRVCTPIGLPIGADIPAEIAISILAELITYKRKPEVTRDRICNDSDLTLDVLEYIAEDDSPKAVVTILTSQGSTPRKAGSKMTVDAQGRIRGSVGGGLGEATAIRLAKEMVGSGTYRVCRFDMNGDVAAEEGMVCGGTLKILIES
ncbi:MAG: XdhC family protein [Lachnospiraceae bacterium]|nr:XdhC family protein [Lachnospiraceae bacterium]